jgi:uncharacterized cupin superfamily protein
VNESDVFDWEPVVREDRQKRIVAFGQSLGFQVALPIEHHLNPNHSKERKQSDLC